MALLFADSPADVDWLRAALAAAGFTASSLAEVLGPNGQQLVARGEVGPALRRTADRSPLSTFIRLFLCGAAVDRTDAERALPNLPLEACENAGLLRADVDTVMARLTLQPVAWESHEWVIASDIAGRADQPTDFVVGVGPASMTLAGLTVRGPARSCLDLGTGSGIQALCARTHADEVVASDRNARAAAFTRFTMALNGVTRVDVREGDRFEPVAGERFDLIVSNPPFVISPGARFVYRDSGLAGDEICHRLVTEAPAHLNDGGWCQILANWAHLRGQHWQDRLAGWIENLGCDAWVVQSRVEDAETYASNWLRHDAAGGDTAAAFDEWMDYYDRIGLEAVGFGLITLRHNERDDPWLCLEELANEFVLPCGNDIAATFDRAAWLASDGADDQRLLATRLVVSPDARLRDTRFAADGAWLPEQTVLQLEHGLRYGASIDAFGGALVAGCDGTTPVGELLQRLAATVDVEVADIAPHSLAILRRMIQQGIVVPV